MQTITTKTATATISDPVLHEVAGYAPATDTIIAVNDGRTYRLRTYNMGEHATHDLTEINGKYMASGTTLDKVVRFDTYNVLKGGEITRTGKNVIRVALKALGY